MNVEWYVQSEGTNIHDHMLGRVDYDTIEANWSQKADHVGAKRSAWARAVRELLGSLQDDRFSVDFASLQFIGRRLNWRGGGTTVLGEGMDGARPSAALAWLNAPGNLDALWAWPAPPDPFDKPGVEATAKLIRKPAVGIQVRIPVAADARTEELAGWMADAFDAFRAALPTRR